MSGQMPAAAETSRQDALRLALDNLWNDQDARIRQLEEQLQLATRERDAALRERDAVKSRCMTLSETNAQLQSRNDALVKYLNGHANELDKLNRTVYNSAAAFDNLDRSLAPNQESLVPLPQPQAELSMRHNELSIQRNDLSAQHDGPPTHRNQLKRKHKYTDVELEQYKKIRPAPPRTSLTAEPAHYMSATMPPPSPSLAPSGGAHDDSPLPDTPDIEKIKVFTPEHGLLDFSAVPAALQTWIRNMEPTFRNHVGEDNWFGTVLKRKTEKGVLCRRPPTTPEDFPNVACDNCCGGQTMCVRRNGDNLILYPLMEKDRVGYAIADRDFWVMRKKGLRKSKQDYTKKQ